jgi:hypothetical protein
VMVGKWNPHLNIMVPGGFITPEVLELIKAALRKAFHCKTLIVNFEYVDTVPQMLHLLKYNTRATFLDLKWDEYMGGQLFNFRNMRSWGKWDSPMLWGDREASVYERLAAFEAGKCDTCGVKMEASKVISIGYFRQWNARGWLHQLGGDYFQLTEPYRARPGPDPDLDYLDVYKLAAWAGSKN